MSTDNNTVDRVHDAVGQVLNPDVIGRLSPDGIAKMRADLVAWFRLDGAHTRAFEVAALGWAYADLLATNKEKLEQERDDARRALCSAIVSEHYSQFDLSVVAAMKWGRAEALRLFPEAVLRKIYGEFACGDEDLAEDLAEARHRLDQRFPPEAST